MSNGKRATGRSRGAGGSRVLVYDGDCPLCDRASALAVRLGGGDRRAFQDLDRPRQDELLSLGIRQEIAVLDEAAGETRTGLDGLLWWAESTRLAGLGYLARPLLPVLAPLYRFVALNRRFLAPPSRSGADCACEPEPRPAWNVAFVVVGGGLSLLFAAWFAASLTAATLGAARSEAVGGTMLAAALFGLAFALLPDPRAGRLRATAHAAGAVLAGSWILGLAAATRLAGTRPWGLLAVVAAVWLATRSWGRRAAHLHCGE